MTRLLIWGARRLRPSIGWAAFFLVVSGAVVAAAGLMDAKWVEGGAIFVSVALVGTLVGAVLAHTRISGPQGALLLGLTGLVYVTNGVSHFLSPLWGGMGELWQGTVWLWLRLWQPDSVLPPPTFALLNESGARLATLGQRLSSWGVALFSGSPERNPVAFLFVSGLLLWACTAWAVWSTIRRGRPLLAMLPLGTVLGLSTYLSGAHVGYLFGFTACAVLLLPSIRLGWQERRWEREGIDYSTEIRFDMWQVAILATVAVLLVSTITPVLHIPRLARAIWDVIQNPQEAIQEALTRFFGGVEPTSPPEIPVAAGSSGGGGVNASLPRSHLLGGNPDLSSQIVMKVCTDAPPPIQEAPFEFREGPRYYWRGITYEVFDGRRWYNRVSSTVEVPAYEPLISLPTTATKSLKQHYLIYVPHGDTLYAVGEPLSVDQSVRSRRRAVDDLVGLEGKTSDYIVSSQVPDTTVGQLMRAGQDYPQRIAESYLTLPQEMPERVHALAPEIVQGAASAYEKAIAIQEYLRRFPYDLDVSSPPAGRNAVDYFLFEVQRGYCDYYASSFVVLAREVGVPARLAVGYAMGQYSPSENCYLVTESDAHSWPEVYFPGYGWVPFEPTAAFGRFERPQDVVFSFDPSLNVPLLPRRPWHIVVREWWRQARYDWQTYGVVAGCMVLLFLLVVRWRRWRWRMSLSPAESVALYYESMCRMGGRLGAARRPQDTPAEYCDRLVAALDARVTSWPWSPKKQLSAMPLIRRSVIAIGSAYQRASYSAQPVSEIMRNQVERQWQHLEQQMRRLRATSQSGTGGSGI